MVAFAHLFEGLHELHEAEVVLALAGEPDEGQHLKSECLAVHFDSVGANDADFFHLLHALGGGCRGEANAPG